ncbi:hypothetical protein C4D60_Mb03t18190 [Musa balbisiana]|uniref:Uncharacterized protein n=1 Tax=Musa balbisiana TaxID=52838 RepID=A0A4S8JAP4_MUSBA|nr:hypothetical protein C4D60_Mb03t18190 [Musa balbisiana]
MVSLLLLCCKQAKEQQEKVGHARKGLMRCMLASKEKAVSAMLRWTDAANVAMCDSYLSVEDERRRKRRETFGVDTLHSMFEVSTGTHPMQSGGGC